MSADEMLSDFVRIARDSHETGGRLRTGIGLLMLVVFVSGCATRPKPPPFALLSDLVVAGKVTAEEELGVFETGDVESAWHSYRLDVTGKSSNGSIAFISSGQNCPIADPSEQNYLIVLYRRSFDVIPPDLHNPSKLKKDFNVASLCLPVDAATATAIQNYSMQYGR